MSTGRKTWNSWNYWANSLVVWGCFSWDSLRFGLCLFISRRKSSIAADGSMWVLTRPPFPPEVLDGVSESAH